MALGLPFLLRNRTAVSALVRQAHTNDGILRLLSLRTPGFVLPRPQKIQGGKASRDAPRQLWPPLSSALAGVPIPTGYR
ncbi:hypothetical protein Cob_v005119 [Colletotrichum orbiculare MAFF 240422]|uniref:Uncharacterized protein n=1 Tax=Colletotrichum orbiculare (strain 104-T / ATCC 96160 / CBS 514.97 / LARS 414 / MAFF 240422) TaxID=1213857 RepID=A0A484FX75_COLOR|nr:hypothetical protein Cob_v005119 [Colletotrichum orbiculare MAFF 240422]